MVLPPYLIWALGGRFTGFLANRPSDVVIVSFFLAVLNGNFDVRPVNSFAVFPAGFLKNVIFQKICLFSSA